MEDSLVGLIMKQAVAQFTLRVLCNTAAVLPAETSGGAVVQCRARPRPSAAGGPTVTDARVTVEETQPSNINKPPLAL